VGFFLSNFRAANTRHETVVSEHLAGKTALQKAAAKPTEHMPPELTGK
jgi:hypothetical protein